MHLSVLGLGLAFVSYLVFLIARSISTGRYHAGEARRLGCEPLPRQKSRLPFGISILRSWLKAIDEMRYPDHIKDTFERMGAATFDFVWLGTPAIFTIDPKNIEAVFATQFEEFVHGDLLIKMPQPLAGAGVFLSDGEEWKHFRKSLRPQFTNAQVSQLSMQERHVQNMMTWLPTSQGGWTETADLFRIFHRLTLDVSTDFLFGESANSQLLAIPGTAVEEKKPFGRPDPEDFVEALEASMQYVEKRARAGPLYWIYNDAKWAGMCKTVHAFTDYYVQQALRRTADPAYLKEYSARKKFVFLEDLAQTIKDPLELRNQAMNIYLAGRDTVAGLLCWFFFVLVRRPDVYDKLRAAVVADFGPYDAGPDSSSADRITLKGLENCKYLQYCMHETNRIYIPVPSNQRSAAKDTTLPSGGGPDGTSRIYVRKGQTIMFSPYSLHRRKDIWGEDANEFRPERWEGKRWTDWTYTPFSGGPRKCIGQQFALTEVGYVVARLVQRFDRLENRDPNPDKVWNKLAVVSSPGNGLTLKFHEASPLAGKG